MLSMERRDKKKGFKMTSTMKAAVEGWILFSRSLFYEMARSFLQAPVGIFETFFAQEESPLVTAEDQTIGDDYVVIVSEGVSPMQG